jgi:signal transduction histidine kinase
MRNMASNLSRNRESPRNPQEPLLVVVLMAVTIFIVEAAVMLVIALLPRFEAWTVAFFDSFLLILFLTPLLYFCIYKPMRFQINALIHARNQLQSEVTERQLVEEALRQSEERLRFLSSQLLSGQEKERVLLSRELHEELAQDLAALNFRLRFIEQIIEKDPASLKSECEQNLELVRQIIGSVRRLSGKLDPIELEHGSLDLALSGLIDRLAQDSGMAVTSHIIELDPLLPQETQIAIYRIVQEAIANVEKHAGAKRLSVVEEQESDHISVTVEDDGQGFDPEVVLLKPPAERGLGLAIMEERIRMLGGSLTIRSQADQGTRISFTIPINQK